MVYNVNIGGGVESQDPTEQQGRTDSKPGVGDVHIVLLYNYNC